jgi:aryl-alcohol dehydrogenase-like predicted oxidoreductase
VLHGFATPDGTRRYAEKFPSALRNDFYSLANEVWVSTLGLGTYLGDPDPQTDEGYEAAALKAFDCGINFIDTSLNYRDQHSERALGSALRIALNANSIQRDQFFMCTKAGYLAPGAIPEFLQEEDVSGAIHSLQPDFLENQLDHSRANLGLDTIDLFYLHNPEVQLHFVRRVTLEQRLQAAFERCERLVKERRIRWYGAATWSGFRETGELDLLRVIDLARYVGGDDHHFRFIQLPFNLAMIEAYQNRDEQGASVLKVAERANITVVASATLNQSSLARELPQVVSGRIPGLKSDAARAIQFTRSTPGISVALVGMSNVEHLRENLGVAEMPPMGTLEYEKLYRPVDA